MPVKRFKKILSNLHANDNQKAISRNEPGFDKLYKVCPLITHLKKKNPGRVFKLFSTIH